MHEPLHRNAVLSLAFFAKYVRAIRRKIPPEYSKFLTMGDTARRVNWAHNEKRSGRDPRDRCIPPGLQLQTLRKKAQNTIADAEEPRQYVQHPVPRRTGSESGKQSVSLGRTGHVRLPRLVVDYRISDIDLESIYRAHVLIDRQLRKQGCGYLTFGKETQQDVLNNMREQVGVGGHHIGTTRMSQEPSEGVVDADCRVHGVPNLFIASSSVFPTSSQANPTLTIVAFAVRIASYITQNVQTL